jgi:uncharacterized protein YigA (DUF484 family)
MGREAPVPSVSATKATTESTAISMMSCAGVKAMLAFCARDARSE